MGTTGMRLGRDDRSTSQEKPHAASGGRPLDRREQNPPYTTPTRLGTGPSDGREELAGDGGRPATRENARRRDGGTGPAANASAACGSGDAAALGRRDKMPSKGIRRRAQGARNRECPVQNVVHLNVSGATLVASERVPMKPATLTVAEGPPRGGAMDTSGARGTFHDSRDHGEADGSEDAYDGDARGGSREAERRSGVAHLETESFDEGAFGRGVAQDSGCAGEAAAATVVPVTCTAEHSASGGASAAIAVEEVCPVQPQAMPASGQPRRRVPHGLDDGKRPQCDGPLGGSGSESALEGSSDSDDIRSNSVAPPHTPNSRAVAARDPRAADRPRSPGAQLRWAEWGLGAHLRPRLAHRGTADGSHRVPRDGQRARGERGCSDGYVGEVVPAGRDHPSGCPRNEVGKTVSDEVTEARDSGASGYCAEGARRPEAPGDRLRRRGLEAVDGTQGGSEEPSNIGQRISVKRRRLRGKQNVLAALASNSMHGEFSGGPLRSTTSTLHRCARDDRDGPLLSGAGTATGSGDGSRPAQCSSADAERQRGRGRPPEGGGPSAEYG